MSAFRRFCAAALLIAVASPATAQGQGNGPLGYQWLQAVRDKDGAKLNKITTTNRSALNSAVLDYQDGEGAIHVAVRQNNTLFVQYMLALGANANLVSARDGETPLTMAITPDDPDLDLVTVLIRYRARVDAVNRRGETPLIKAVIGHKLRATEFLLKQGADADKADYSGKSARTYAADPRYPAIAKMIADAPRQHARPVAGPKLN